MMKRILEDRRLGRFDPSIFLIAGLRK